MDSGMPYTIDLDPVVSLARSQGYRRIVLQMPDGLKQYAYRLAQRLSEDLPGVEVLIHMDHNYGACDLQYPQLWEALRPDLIVHIGHSPYPADISSRIVEPRGRGPRILYLPALSNSYPSRGAVEDAARLLLGRGVERVGIATTSQHVHMVKRLAEDLSGMGFRVEVGRSSRPYLSEAQVLGCDYRLHRSMRVDGFIYLGGGVFHPLGLYLATMKPVIKLDPYEDRAVDLTGEGEKLYRVRLYKVSQAMDARRWGIIVGLKTGQYRPWLIDRLRRMMERHGRRYILLASENLDRETLSSIDGEWFEAYTVTSCPRLPTDDYWDYHKPVLTPGEAVMALRGSLEPYLFPW